MASMSSPASSQGQERRRPIRASSAVGTSITEGMSAGTRLPRWSLPGEASRPHQERSSTELPDSSTAAASGVKSWGARVKPRYSRATRTTPGAAKAAQSSTGRSRGHQPVAPGGRTFSNPARKNGVSTRP
jgi:hypothetical protein